MSSRPGAAAEGRLAAIDRVIDRDELVQLVLELCNIPSPMGTGGEAGQFVFDWLAREGFAPRKAGLVAERFNVIGEYGGGGAAGVEGVAADGSMVGAGRNLLFTSHLDTESPLYHPDDRYSLRPGTAADPQWLRAWLEGDMFFGHAVGNDRGPMACFLIAARALKRAGLELAGTLYLSACPGEIGPEPAEEHQGPAYLGKEVGAAYLLAHGGVAPDFVIAAEGTDFGVNWTACGYANYCITVYGEAVFTPLLTHPERLADHPNPIVRMTHVIALLQEWARGYEIRHRYEGVGGTAIPKVQIGAIRGGNARSLGAGSEVCSLYVEINLTPRQRIADVDRELRTLFRDANCRDVELRPFVLRHGFEAEAGAVEPLRRALDVAHRAVRGAPIALSAPVYSSMWRDHNVFNMNGIPAVTMGPVRWRPRIDDLVACAKLYALTALEVCGVQER